MPSLRRLTDEATGDLIRFCNIFKDIILGEEIKLNLGHDCVEGHDRLGKRMCIC